MDFRLDPCGKVDRVHECFLVKLVVPESIEQFTNICLTQKRYIVELSNLYHGLCVVGLLEKLSWANVLNELLDHQDSLALEGALLSLELKRPEMVPKVKEWSLFH